MPSVIFPSQSDRKELGSVWYAGGSDIAYEDMYTVVLIMMFAHMQPEHSRIRIFFYLFFILG